MKRVLIIAAALFAFLSPAFAADSTVPAMGNSISVAGTDTFYCIQSSGTVEHQCSSIQLAAYIFGQVSGSLSCNGTGTCTVTTNANLTGDVTSVGNATTLTNGPVIAKVLTGYTSGAGTVSSADSILSALQKINGNDALKLPLAGGTMSGNIAMGGNAITGGGAISGTTITGTSYVGLPNGTNAAKGVVEGDGSTINCVAGVCSATTGGGGTVTSVSAGCGTSTGGSPITTTGAVAAAISSRTNATTSDPIVSTDCGNIVYENSASAVAVNLPVATTSGFGTGTFFNVCNINAGAVTITPTTSTIGGAATLVINAGTASHPNCVPFKSDGTNYSLMDTVTGAGVQAALGIAVGSAGGPVTNGGALGTPSSGTLTNTTGFPLASLAGAGTGVLGAAANNLSAAGGLTTTIASGTAALGTSAIASGACATVVTVTATNVATTDTISFGYNGDPTAVTGYGASATGAVLSIYPYPSSGNVNVKVCNSTAASITPSALTLNWRAWR